MSAQVRPQIRDSRTLNYAERRPLISARAAASRRSISSSHDTIAASKTTPQDTTIHRPRPPGNGARHHQLTQEEPHPSYIELLVVFRTHSPTESS